MSFLIKNVADAPVTQWSGGSITQLAIDPPEEVYEDKKFLWYVSLASVEQETSHFTVMPDYDRWIVMLNHPVSLSHDGKAAIHLLPMRPHFFDGGSYTVSTGSSCDFNLIVRKGISKGSLFSCRMAPGESREIVKDSATNFRHFTCLLYCSQGHCRFLKRDLAAAVLCADQYAVCEHGLTVENSASSQTELMVCRIYR